MIVVKEFPRASELNSLLYDIVLENLSGNIKAKKAPIGAYHKTEQAGIITDYNLHNQNIKEIDGLTSWISRVLPDVSKNFATKTKPRVGLYFYEDKHKYDFDVNSFEIAHCWGIHYNKNDSVLEHNHFPALLSFIYYVRTPKGSAPIIIEGESHSVKEGQCIFYLASQYHSADESEGAGRCAIVGNIIYNGYNKKFGE